MDEVSFLAPELGPLTALIVGPEQGRWVCDEVDVSSSRTGHTDRWAGRPRGHAGRLSCWEHIGGRAWLCLKQPARRSADPDQPPAPRCRFVCRESLGEGGDEPAAYLQPVPPGAVVYGSGDAAVVVSKASRLAPKRAPAGAPAHACMSVGRRRRRLLPKHRPFPNTLPPTPAPIPLPPGGGRPAVQPQHGAVRRSQVAAGGRHRGARGPGQRAGVRGRRGSAGAGRPCSCAGHAGRPHAGGCHVFITSHSQRACANHASQPPSPLHPCAGGRDLALPFALGGASGMLYQYMLQAGAPLAKLSSCCFRRSGRCQFRGLLISRH